MQNILVAGGNGFIASHLVDKLASLACRVIVFDVYPRAYEQLPEGVTFVQGSLQDIHLVRRTLADNQIEVVYNAAWASIPETSLKDPVEDIQSNVVSSINLLSACRDLGVKRIVYLSSGGTVYGLPKGLPMTEDHPTEPISAYGITKLMVEKYTRMFHYLYGLEYIILRPSVPYGPRQSPFHSQGVISTFIYKALKNEPVTIFGDGEVVRDYFYIEDLTRALVAAKDVAFDPLRTTFNLGGMKPLNLNDLVKIVGSVLGKKIHAKYEPARKFDVPSILLDTSSAQSYLKWKLTISLEEGIRRFSDWLQNWIIH